MPEPTSVNVEPGDGSEITTVWVGPRPAGQASLPDDVRACIELVRRSGAVGFALRNASDNPTGPRWYATAYFTGARATESDHRSASAAAQALAERILRASVCRCGKRVTIDRPPGRSLCRWERDGPHWMPGCDAPNFVMPPGKRGNLDAMIAEAEAQAAARRGGNN